MTPEAAIVTPDHTAMLPASEAIEVGRVEPPPIELAGHDSDTQLSSAVPDPGNGKVPADSTAANPARRPRATPSQEAPFAWQAKAALRAIGLCT